MGGEAVLGGIGGYLNNQSKQDQQQALIQQLQGLSPEIQQAYLAQMGLNAPLAGESAAYGNSATNIGNYTAAEQNIANQTAEGKFNVAAPSAFTYSLPALTSALLNPNVAYQTQLGTAALNEGGNQAGNLYSGAAAKALQALGQNNAMSAYGTAQTAAQTSANTGYDAWLQNFNNQREAAATTLANLQAGAQALGVPVAQQQGIFNQIQTNTGNAINTSANRGLAVGSELAGANATLEGLSSPYAELGSALGGATGAVTPQAAVTLGNMFGTTQAPTADMRYNTYLAGNAINTLNNSTASVNGSYLNSNALPSNEILGGITPSTTGVNFGNLGQ